MAGEKEDATQSIRRRLSGAVPHVTDDRGSGESTADDLMPLGAMGRVDLVRLAKVFAKVIAILAAALVPAYTAFRVAKDTADQAAAVKAQEVKQKQEATFQEVRRDVEALKGQLYDMQLERASRAREEALRDRRRARAAGRPTPAASLPPLPAPPKPLSNDVDEAARKAEAQRKSAQPRGDAGAPPGQ